VPNRFTKRALLATTWMAGIALAGPGFAQAGPTEADPVEQTVPETVTDVDARGDVVPADTADIIVTGSRIRRANIENSVPTAVIGEEMFEATNATNFADVANQLPQFAASFGASRTQSTFSGAATSGLQLVNLRNLGAFRTLTLINGRRMPGGTTTGTSVDFNTIPSANIDRVEVITGGASAIYGADAVAGVVNIITRSNFEGVELGASYRETRYGDNETPQAYGIFGTKIGDGGHAVVTLEWTKQGDVSCADRYLCAEDFAWFPPADPVRGPLARSGVSAFGRFFVPDNPALGGDQSTSVIRSGETFSTALHGFNRNAARTLAQDTTRYLIQAEASYEIQPWLTPFIEINYGLARTQADFEGHPFQSSAAGSLFGGGPGVAGLPANIPVYIPTVAGENCFGAVLAAGCVANPIVPGAFRTAVLANNPATREIVWWQRFGEEGTQPRGAENERQMFRTVAGIRGELPFGNNWNYEASYMQGQTTLDSLTQGLISTRALYYGLRTEMFDADGAGPLAPALRCSDAGARATGCVPLNPFDGFSPEEVDAISIAAGQHGRSKITDLQAYVSGDLFRLPGGDLAVAFGLENRSFSGFLDYDEPINNATVTGNQIGDVDKVKRRTKEAFAEVIAPVIGDLPFLERLTLEGAYRISDPSVGGNYNTWRYGGVAEFIPGLRARVMRAKAVREPQPGELSGVGQTFGVVTDPCARPNATTARNPIYDARCLAAGVPATYNPPLSVRQGTGGFVGGNPDLEPETGKTLTYGIAFAPPSSGPLGFLNGLQLTVDFFKIQMDDVVSTVGRQTKVNRCYETGEFCEDVVRGTNPLVTGPIALLAVNDQVINVAKLDVRGIDFEARYSFNRLPIPGSLSLHALATHYTKAEITDLPGDEPRNILGFAGGDTIEQGYVKWTGNGNISYELGGTRLNWNMRYIGKAGTASFADNGITIGDRWYHNVRLSHGFGGILGGDFEIFGGINNLFDKDPPFFPSGTAGTQALDTIPAYYDVFGREFFGGVRVNFTPQRAVAEAAPVVATPPPPPPAPPATQTCADSSVILATEACPAPPPPAPAPERG
jgi:iron complex outermembrane recepter protein